MDLIFVPAGVLAALLFNSAPPAAFALFAALMVVFVLSFNGIGRSLERGRRRTAPLLAARSQARRALHGALRIDELGDRIVDGDAHVVPLR